MDDRIKSLYLHAEYDNSDQQHADILTRNNMGSPTAEPGTWSDGNHVRRSSTSLKMGTEFYCYGATGSLVFI